jgi:hypothetical protein
LVPWVLGFRADAPRPFVDRDRCSRSK